MTLTIARRGSLCGRVVANSVTIFVFLFIGFKSMGFSLAQEDPFKPLIYGNSTASVKVVEYISLTCPHCRQFHEQVFPKIKEKYIDTGLISFEIRDFPLDGMALQASVMSRCVGSVNVRSKFIGLLLEEQQVWSSEADHRTLNRYAKDAGLSDEQIQSCSDNEAIRQRVVQQRREGSSVHKVRATPTILINDKVVDGALSFENLSREIDKSLP
jgi:protein-disulfide isomerase